VSIFGPRKSQWLRCPVNKKLSKWYLICEDLNERWGLNTKPPNLTGKHIETQTHTHTHTYVIESGKKYVKSKTKVKCNDLN